ncbi:MAG: L-lactate dehydrogenase complex protein LldF [Hyphomicrobiaceae bacterium]|jgi:L-lactate dehydrogenase complex protein LldF
MAFANPQRRHNPMQQTSHKFKDNVKHALKQPNLRTAIDRTTGLLTSRRRETLAQYPEYAEARATAERIKDHTLDYLDHYLEMFEKNAIASGAKVYWAATPKQATDTIIDICKSHDAKSVTRAKSMLGEEIGIGEALAEAGIERVETDLAEHIIQLADEPPSHIVVPALHKTREEVAELFTEHHADPHKTDDVAALVESARRELRPKYVGADIGISGANFLIADTGSICTVTNEGNAELTTTLPKVHIVNVGIDKLVPSMGHCAVFIRLLSRAALGTEISQYTTYYNGPKRSGDVDGPEELHIVLVDNRRTEIFDSFMKPMLRCIRCGACMNHCPVYNAVGGHPYGYVYPGPMGAILTPAMTSLEEAGDLPNACTLNGRCQEVCPVNIPLPDMMRRLREEQWRRKLTPASMRVGLGFWAFAVKRPWLYRLGTRFSVVMMRWVARAKGKITSLPGAGGWTRHRDLTAPQQGTFMDQYKRGRRS